MNIRIELFLWTKGVSQTPKIPMELIQITAVTSNSRFESFTHKFTSSWALIYFRQMS
uniref:Uncharacterized protein n=1 Tax=Oryza brachyantha TaxID=4533 RepID=J3MMB6_ORYBR